MKNKLISIFPTISLLCLLGKVFNLRVKECQIPMTVIGLNNNMSLYLISFFVAYLKIGNIPLVTRKKIIWVILIISVLLLVNLLGFEVLVDQGVYDSGCFSKTDVVLFGTCIFLIICIFLLSIAITISYFLYLRRMNNRRNFENMYMDKDLIRNELIRKNLNTIYLNHHLQSKNRVLDFFKNEEMNQAMIKLPALKNEIRMFKDTFLKQIESTDERELSCPICYNDCKETEYMYTLKCEHYFHQTCFEEWLKNQVNCPVCKLNVRRMLIECVMRNDSD